jgi:hypothetical protein
MLCRLPLTTERVAFEDQPAEATDRQAGSHATRDECAHGAHARAGAISSSPAATTELIAVAPGGKFRAERLADADELRAVA